MATHNNTSFNEWNEIENIIVSKIDKNKNYKLIKEYKEVNANESKKFDNYKHAAHAFIWSPNSATLFTDSNISLKASILMNMRFDGCIGFPGGYIDDTDKSIEDGLNRELIEEINLNKIYMITKEDFLFAHVNENRKIVLHFYAKLVSPVEFLDIERTCLESLDWGGEVLGILKPPLYRMEETSDRGLPTFIKNEFIGNSLLQLFHSLLKLGILKKDEIISFL